MRGDYTQSSHLLNLLRIPPIKKDIKTIYFFSYRYLTMRILYFALHLQIKGFWYICLLNQ